MTGHYDPFRVALSIVISILSSWAALELAGRVSAERRGAGRAIWICWGATAMGFGIWSMHYVGMLAYRTEMPVLYDWPTVLLSMFAAVASSALALTILKARVLTWPASVFGSIAMGGGIAAMHYIGMSAMRMPMNITYSRDLVTMSIAVAILTSMAALRFAFASKGIDEVFHKRKIFSALLMGLAIAEVHYIGMAAAQWKEGAGNFLPRELHHAIQISDFSTVGLAIVTGVLMAMVMVTVGLDRHFVRYKSVLRGSQSRYNYQRRHNHRLQGAFRANGVGIWEYDPIKDAFVIDAPSRHMYELDFPGEAVPRNTWKLRVHPEDIEALDARWSAALALEDKYENEYRVVLNDGSVRRYRSIASIVRGSKGDVERVYGMSWDVTVERQREQDVADQSERFKMTLEAVADAVITVDSECRILYMNPAASALTGWSLAEVAGAPVEQVFVVLDETTGSVRQGTVMQCVQNGKSFSSNDGMLLHRKGKRYNIKERIAVTSNNQAAVVTFQDVTVARSLERKLEYAATHDALTGLMNRAAFEKKLDALWEENRFNSRSHCLCILDLDRFKIINDTSGHIAGDALLREISRVMRQTIQPSDTVARMGGDEFMLLFVDTPLEDGRSRADELLKAIADLRFPWCGKTYDVTASLGLVEFDCFSPRPEVLISQADVANFTSKNGGRNRVSLYVDDGTASNNHQEMQVVADLRRAIESDSFELHAQAIVPAGSSAPATYFEVLLRMRDENGNLVPPALFIPAAERYGLMTMVDRWVIHNALKMYGPLCGDCNSRFAINLSADSLSDSGLWAYVQGEFRRSGVPPASITFEVTETGLIRNFETAKRFMKQAQLAGSRIALDDFGTGLSSLSYLKQFPLDVVKVDGSFIRQLLSNPLDRSIVHAVAQIARSMKAVTVAECVEDVPTIALLQQLGVDFVQGWAIGRPGSMSVLMEGLAQRAEDEAEALLLA